MTGIVRKSITEKRCTKCFAFKPSDDFAKRKNGRKSWCKTCANRALNAWKMKNRDHCREYSAKRWRENADYRDQQRTRARERYHENPILVREQRLRNKYGISLSEYSQMNQEQKGLCAICDQECSTGRDLAVDHDHANGEVRKLLCGKCNCAIGLFDENPERLVVAAEYLKSHSTKQPGTGDQVQTQKRERVTA